MTDTSAADVPVLKRELTDIPGDVREVDAPPIPTLSDPYAFRLADPVTDAEMLSEWMNRPHLAAAWEYDWPADRWRQHLLAQLDGRYSRPVIGSVAGADTAYIELYRAAKDFIAHRYPAHPHDVGVHIAIADMSAMNSGLVASLFVPVVVGIFELDPRCRRIMFDPDHRNAKARRVCEMAGCAFLGEHDVSNRRMALYALPRTPDDIPAVD